MPAALSSTARSHTRAAGTAGGGVCENPCMEDFTLYEGDCMDFLRSLPDGCASLVLTDPPYNIGKDKEWDVIENYTEWMTGWMKEAERVLKENGVFYFWHNDIAQAAEVLYAMKRETSFLIIRIFLQKPSVRGGVQTLQKIRNRTWMNYPAAVLMYNHTQHLFPGCGLFPEQRERKYRFAAETGHAGNRKKFCRRKIRNIQAFYTGNSAFHIPQEFPGRRIPGLKNRNAVFFPSRRKIPENQALDIAVPFPGN